MRLRTCLLCNSNNLITALKLNPTPIADAFVTKKYINIRQQHYPLTLVLCKRCGHLQLRDIVPPEKLYRNYIYHTSKSPGLIHHFKYYVRDVLDKAKPVLNSLVVDIGSNDGTLLKEFNSAGYKILGIDPAKQVARMATRAGTPTLPEFFTPKLAREIRKKYGQAEIITANNVMANVINLDEFVSGIKELLAPRGIFVFESLYLLNLIQNKVFDNIYHEHVSYFSVKPLVIFFKKHNMQLIDADHISTKGGSIRYKVAFTPKSKAISSSMRMLISEESKLALHRIEIFRTFYTSISKTRDNLKKLIDQLKKNKKTIAGFGASPSGTTLMYHFGLLNALDYLVDENPIKIGTFSPGCHIPVVSANELYSRKPDYTVLLAWRFADRITQNYKKYHQLGGRFIVPLPTVHII